jgi:hypothetical protein
MPKSAVRVFDLRDQPEDAYMVTLGWLFDIAENLRPEDLDEIEATSGIDPLIAVIASVADSELGFVIFHEEQPIAVFGAAPVAGMEQDSGQVWMVGTSVMDKPSVALSILRKTRPYIDVLQARFPCLWNWIDARNDKSMRWLSWAGFTIISADLTHGREGRPFFQFARQEAPLIV